MQEVEEKKKRQSKAAVGTTAWTGGKVKRETPALWHGHGL